MQNVFYIPEKTNYVVVSDMFAKDYAGGAELTLDAILQKCPGSYFEMHSSALTLDLVEKYSNKYWIIGNFAGADVNAIAELVRSNVRFSIVECDYKYCKYRSSHLHALQEGKPCDCNQRRSGRFVRALFGRAHKVFFMSQTQLDEYNRLFPEQKSDNFVVQTSTFSDKTLDKLAELREIRNSRIPNEKYVVLKGGTWIKAEKETVEWCKSKNIDFDLVGGLPHQQFLEEISKYKGLVFRPAGFDTCPRLTIEAKLLGLDCLLNENVQHKDEAWYAGSIEKCETYLRNRANHFWEQINAEER